MEESQVSQLIKNLNTGLVIMGLSGMKRAFRFTPVQTTSGELATIIRNLGFNCPVGQKDTYHWTTDWKIWNACLDVITNIAKNFKWTAEIFDCDQRAIFVKTLCDVFLGINTCGIAYVKIRKLDGTEIGLHYCNIIITTDKKAYLYDVDFGNRGQITGVDPIVGNNKYELNKVEFY